MPDKNIVLTEIEPFLTENRIYNLYSEENLLNRKGYIVGEKVRYTDFIAQQLLLPENIKLLKGIPAAPRNGKGQEGYNVEHEKVELNPSEEITEERLARSWMNETFPILGKVIDYQTPLQPYEKENPDKNRKFGKIDLLAWDKQSLKILEFKRSDSDESLLRCVLEAYTYLKTVGHKKLANDFGYDDAPVRAAVLIYEGSQSQPYNDWQDEEKELSNVKKLMKELKIGLYTIDNDKDMNITEVVRFD